MAGQCLCSGPKYHLHTAASCGCCTRCVCLHVSNGWTMPVLWFEIPPAYCSKLRVMYQVRVLAFQLWLDNACVVVRNTTCILQQAAGDVPGACVGMSVMAGQCLCCGLKYHLHTAAGCGCCTRCVCWHVSNGWTMPVFWSQMSPAYCSRLWVLYQVRVLACQ
jgi:hypothetical protein